jgi:hypothetical protein
VLEKRVSLGFVVVAVSVLALAVLGCSSSQSQGTGASQETVALPPTQRADDSPSTDTVESLQVLPAYAPLVSAVQDIVLADKSWTYEPKADITADESRLLLYAIIQRVAADGTWLTLDAEKFYEGTQGAAYRTENQVVHPQTLPIHPDCNIILQGGGVGDVSLQGTRGTHFAVESPSRFASNWNADPNFGDSEFGFWIVVDNGRITTILGQYSP